jgi:hypothetical protein
MVRKPALVIIVSFIWKSFLGRSQNYEEPSLIRFSQKHEFLIWFFFHHGNTIPCTKKKKHFLETFFFPGGGCFKTRLHFSTLVSIDQDMKNKVGNKNRRRKVCIAWQIDASMKEIFHFSRNSIEKNSPKLQIKKQKYYFKANKAKLVSFFSYMSK